MDRAVTLTAPAWHAGERMAVLATDTFMGVPPRIHLLPIAEDMDDQVGLLLQPLWCPPGSRGCWGSPAPHLVQKAHRALPGLRPLPAQPPCGCVVADLGANPDHDGAQGPRHARLLHRLQPDAGHLARRRFRQALGHGDRQHDPGGAGGLG
jgi:hypothetical protein